MLSGRARLPIPIQDRLFFVSTSGPSPVPNDPGPYRRLLRAAEQARRLFSVHWELTYRCNQACAHCYLDTQPAASDAAGDPELSTAECLALIDQMAELGVFTLALSGGEILARRDFFEIAAYARRKRMLLRLFTNATRISPAVAGRIAALHPYTAEVSLYSADPDQHDAITRRPGAWRRTLAGVGNLRAEGVRVIIKTPLMHATVRQIDAIERLAGELGAAFHYDITLTAKDSGDPAPLRYRLTDDDLLWLMRQRIDPDLWTGRRVALDAPTCGIASKAVAIDPYGNVSACLQVRQPAGSLRRASLRSIWEESPLWGDLERLRLGDLPACAACDLRRVCVRCHGLALEESGDLRAPAEVNCREARARRQALMELGLWNECEMIG